MACDHLYTFPDMHHPTCGAYVAYFCGSLVTTPSVCEPNFKHHVHGWEQELDTGLQRPPFRQPEETEGDLWSKGEQKWSGRWSDGKCEEVEH